MAYKIKDFSKIIGVEPHNLRFYEEKGLPEAERDESGYRVYNIRNAYDVNSFLAFQAMGFTVQESAELLKGIEPLALVERLAENDRKMEKEIEVLKSRISWNRKLAEYCRHLVEDPDWAELLELEPVYFLQASDKEDLEISKESDREIAAWVAEVPNVHFVSLTARESFIGDGRALNLGYSVNESDFKRLELPASEHTKKLPMGKCVVWTQACDKELPTLRLSPHLGRFLEDNHLRISGDMLAIYFMPKFPKEGAGSFIGAVPVECTDR